ncbi:MULTISPECIES: CocE/NonD family hydrolase [unclassified Micromonospora]|uniref:alpha/beta hydrolase n=1 Tax=unclassified Micromonospora TaxID=2617518 RepID=UPI0033329B40
MKPPSPPADPTGRAETWLAGTLFLVIAGYLLDDAVLHPEPGTTAADHILSALPVSALLWTAWRHAAWRAPARAAVSTAVGLLALGVGLAVPVAHATSAGPAGDDYTGIAATAAGGALLAVGVRGAWRARRTGGSTRARVLRRILVGAGAAFVAVQVVLPLGVAFVATHAPRDVPPSFSPGDPWRAVRLPTADGLSLAAWYAPGHNGAAVVVVPGHGGLRHARMLRRHGYGVLLVSPRGQGTSEGDVNLFGWRGETDVRAALAFLAGRPEVDPRRVGGLGLSVGGEILLQAAARGTGLRAVVAEGAGTRWAAEDLAHPDLENLVLAPMSVTITLGVAVFSGGLPPPTLPSLLTRLGDARALLIWSRRGQGGEHLNPRYHQAAGGAADIWEIPEAGHTGGLAARPQEYERRVAGFLDATLAAEPAGR